MSFDLTNKLVEDVAHIRETLAANTAILQINTDQLKEHMKRSEANEQSVRLLEKQLEPIRTHVSNVRLVVKILMWVLGSGGTAMLFIKGLLSVPPV